MTETLAEAELYRPREAGYLTTVETDDGTIKLSGIAAEGAPEFGEDVLEAAISVLRQAGAPKPNFGAGFAVLHHGEEAWWLLMHWWLPGGIVSHGLWRADLGMTPPDFSPVPPGPMACVWELGVIDFERRAFMATAMAGAPLADYFASRMPRSRV